MNELYLELTKIQAEIALLKAQLNTIFFKISSSLDTRVQLYKQCTEFNPKIEPLLNQKEILEREFSSGESKERVG